MPTINLGRVKGDDGANVYIKYNSTAADAGAGDSFVAGVHKYIGFLTSSSKVKPAGGYTWMKFIGENGAPGAPGANGRNGIDGADGKSCHIKFSATDSITGATDTWSQGQSWIGFALSDSAAAPTQNSEYRWSRLMVPVTYVGEIREYDYTGISTAVIPIADRFDTDIKMNLYFGGVWEPYAGGQVLVGQNSAFPIGTTGGTSRNVLSQHELPPHNSLVRFANWYGFRLEGTAYADGKNYLRAPYLEPSGAEGTYGSDLVGAYNGDNNSVENMPPYRTIYRWRRIA